MNNESLNAFRDSVRDLLGRADQLQRIRTLRGRAPGFERAVWTQLAEAGWLSILVPEHLGGLGLGLREVAAIAEEIGAHLLPEPFIGGGVQAICALSACPDSALKQELIEAAGGGTLLLGLAWQEQPAQTDCTAIATQLTTDGDALLLSGSKQFVVPGNGADGWLVSALVGKTLQLVWVPAQTPGLTMVDEQRIDGSVMTRLTLERVRVARANVLAIADSAVAAITLANDAARIAQSAELLGVARRALAIMLDYLKTRVQFGKPIGSFQALQHRAVDAYIQTEIAAACLNEVLGLMERGDALEPLAARAKARCAHTAIMVTRLAVQFHGAMGFTDECRNPLRIRR